MQALQIMYHVSPGQSNALISPQPENNPSPMDSTIILQDDNETAVATGTCTQPKPSKADSFLETRQSPARLVIT